MAKKKSTRRGGANAHTPARARAGDAAPPATAGAFRAKIRTYRQGLGDCHLIRLPRKDDSSRDYFIMIDCGVVLGTPQPEEKMTPVVRDIMKETGGEVDLLLVTHEHWDHLSGFIQAKEEFRGFKPDQIWLAWTEDPNDATANKLRQEKEKALTALRLAASHLRLAGASEKSAEIDGVLEFFGAGKGASTKDALDIVRGFNEQSIRYCRPTDPPTVPPELDGVRLFILGPPTDERLLKRTNPKSSEGYGLALANFNEQIAPILSGNEEAGPFDPIYAIPFEIAGEIDFFKDRYWRAGEMGEGWRRIDASWLDGSEELALQLDNMTNNTSLVLAIELAGGEVLLFVADAQVGNWLSWQDLSWQVESGTVSGPKLLKETIFYKVGHHGSHNATLRPKGLDMMEKLRVAFVPVDHAVAVKKGWKRMPLPEIIAELARKTNGNVFQSDMALDVKVPANVTATPLYFEVRF
jgi:hypothetical protein